MKKPFKIRPAGKNDVPFLEAIADATGLFPSEMLDGMIAGYFDRSTQDIWFVCEDGGQAISFGFCEPERMTVGTWNLLAIGVLPERQSAGVGAAMLRYLENQLRQRDARVLLVETLGTPEFARTREFYLKNGFVEEARIRDFYEAGGDKVVFWKQV